MTEGERQLTPEEIALYRNGVPADGDTWLEIDARLHASPALRASIERDASAWGSKPAWLSASESPTVPFDIEEALLERYVCQTATPIERELVELAMEESPQVAEAVRVLQQFQEQMQGYDWTAVQGVLAESAPEVVRVPDAPPVSAPVFVTSPLPASASRPTPAVQEQAAPKAASVPVPEHTTPERPGLAAALTKMLSSLRRRPVPASEGAEAGKTASSRPILRPRSTLLWLYAAMGCGVLFATLYRLNKPSPALQQSNPPPADNAVRLPVAPSNLDFSRGLLHLLPDGWGEPQPSRDAGYTVEFVVEGHQSGKHSVQIARDPAHPSMSNGPSINKVGFGNVMQTFSAAAYRGKRVRFRAYVRYEGPALAGQAQLWLRADRPHEQMGFFDNMSDRPIQSKTWQAYEIAGVIDKDAESISIGMLMKGSGKVWMSDASFDVLP